SRPSTSAWTSAASSSPGSATPATASTASRRSDPLQGTRGRHRRLVGHRAGLRRGPRPPRAPRAPRRHAGGAPPPARGAARPRRRAARLAGDGAPSPRVAVCDLATPEGRAACREAVDALGEPPDVVVLNAGFGSRGSFARLDPDREVRMVELNAVAVVDLA